MVLRLCSWLLAQFRKGMVLGFGQNSGDRRARGDGKGDCGWGTGPVMDTI